MPIPKVFLLERNIKDVLGLNLSVFGSATGSKSNLKAENISCLVELNLAIHNRIPAKDIHAPCKVLLKAPHIARN